MRHFTIILLALVLVLSCTPEEIWDQESKAQAYFSALFIVNREVVYNLDYMYEASTLMDAVQNNGDVETIMSRYFSMQDRISISYSPSDNSVKIDAGNKTLDIITGGKLLTASVPKFRFSTLQNVKGSNPYEYYQGEPIFIGKFFLSGKETATFGESNNADCFEADYSLYQAKLNGITYSL